MTEDTFRPAWGTALLPDGRLRFRLWAPDAGEVVLRLPDGDIDMQAEDAGWYEHIASDVPFGSDYSFVVDGRARPDPAARAQADDVHGPSRVVDPHSYDWQETDWTGRPWEEAVIYELHVGTFTEEGTFRAAIDRLHHLAMLGVTAIELMPVAHFSGDRGWGYDGVLLYAPHPAYGTPDDLKALVDAAHGHDLMIFLDVVYNHFGPDGNYLHDYADAFFDANRHTPWGAGIDFHKRPVRDFFIDNALYWIEEFRFDGLRFDAIDNIIDSSATHILEELALRVRARVTGRPVHLMTEDQRNIISLHRRGTDGTVPLYTAEWNDDLHNAAHVIATGESGGYYVDFEDQSWRKLARALAEGFAFQGEVSTHMDGQPRGVPSRDQPPTAFISFLQNHDQTGNRALGERLPKLADPAVLEVLTVMLLLSPQIPLLFMGEEWGETRPFLFFTDFHGELAAAVREGRRKEFAAFPEFNDAHERATIPDPNDAATFADSRIDWTQLETEKGQTSSDFYKALLHLRHERIMPHLADAKGGMGEILACEDGFAAISWRLNAARLGMAINLSQEARGSHLPERADHLYAINVEDDTLTAPGILVTLDEASS